MAKILLGIMIASGIPFTFMLVQSYMKRKAEGRLEEESFIKMGLIGALANFFDTLGLSSFAIETSLFKNFNLVSDEKLPGTLNVGATIPTLFQACIFIASVNVEPLTLFSMIVAALAGAIVGAGLISKLPKKTIQLAMGIALFSMAIILLAGQLNLFPVGGDAMGLHGTKLIIAIVGNFIFGALNTLGIGLFAPCMTLVYMLGMSPIAAFPIMMGSCALLLPFAGMKFIKEDTHSAQGSMAVNVMGPIGVLIAAFLVKSMDVYLLKWLLIFVVVYTTFMMFKSYKETTAKENKRVA
ncbi:sulfite exporter TauE/SafE family protein [Tepidibacter aestuarii]|uniref:sulfite exporter TauE/SafE family protein n=1 Tax=Tepidibacter aestuarii TaxID=2925782 RepID=UPI0020BF50EC|nr:sulfite exporter TauE/SafE family protein [Tepidibacter aestuarii]CAH2214736.1 putative membrane transporter protein [Tepidibacter aestuarii]